MNAQRKEAWLLGTALAVVMVVCGLVLGACSTAPQTAATLQSKVVEACAVWEPTAKDIMATYPTINPQVDQAIGAVNAICANAATVQTQSLSGLVNTILPDAIQMVGTLGLPAAEATQIQQALSIVNVALAAAVAVYGQPASAPPPASAASAPA